jgi:GNAT superfamily N-acetyltransferase
MHPHEILALFDRQQRIEIEYPDMRKEVLPHVTRFVRPAPGMSFILHSRLNESNADAAIQEQIAYFTQRDQPFEWKVYDYDTPPDLRDRLVAHGFEPDDPDAVMVLDMQAAPPTLLAPVEADVRRIAERDQLEDVIRVEEQVWGRNFDWITTRLGNHLEIPGYLSVYVAYVDGQPACAGWVYYHRNSQFASLWGGSTVPAYRQHGLYTAVLARRVQEAVERGYHFLTIDASPMSRPIVAKHGFQLLTYAHACEWKGART